MHFGANYNIDSVQAFIIPSFLFKITIGLS